MEPPPLPATLVPWGGGSPSAARGAQHYPPAPKAISDLTSCALQRGHRSPGGLHRVLLPQVGLCRAPFVPLGGLVLKTWALGRTPGPGRVVLVWAGGSVPAVPRSQGGCSPNSQSLQTNAVPCLGWGRSGTPVGPTVLGRDAWINALLLFVLYLRPWHGDGCSVLGGPAVPQPTSSANVSASHGLCRGVRSPPPGAAPSIFVLFVNRYLYQLALDGVCDGRRSGSSCAWGCTRVGCVLCGWCVLRARGHCTACTHRHTLHTQCTCGICVLCMFVWVCADTHTCAVWMLCFVCVGCTVYDMWCVCVYIRMYAYVPVLYTQ